MLSYNISTNGGTMKSRFTIILIAIILGFGAILFLSKKDAANPVDSNGNAVQATNHTKGEGAKITLTEYGDFQCPACAGYYPLVEEVLAKHKQDITFQFRHFPLRQIHPNAMLAHRSAEAASNQGKFWEMYDLLYRGQDSWSSVSDPSSIFNSYAESLKLDMTKFNAELKTEVTNAIINADIAEGEKLGISGTPTFLIDGKIIESPRTLDEFNKVIEDAIKAKEQQ